MLKSRSTRVIAGFIAGLALGASLAAFYPAGSVAALPTLTVVGALWLHSLQMPIVPLVFSLIVTGVVSALSASDAGSLAGKLFALFAVLLAAAATFAAFALTELMALFPIPPGSLASIRSALAGTTAAPISPPPLAEWLISIIPTNPVEAAAKSAMVQFVLFAIVFALAVTRIEPPERQRLAGVFEALAKTMLVIIHWALLAAPLGVFALAFVLGAKSGLTAAGTLAHYTIMMIVLNLMIMVFCYLLAMVGGRVPFGRFVRAALPPQAMAASTQSSLACLPAMVEATQKGLGIPTHIAGIVLPLAAATFRITSPSINLAVAIYSAHIFGIPLDALTLAAGVGMACLMTLASSGLPSQSNFLVTTTPICVVMGVPIAALPLMMAIEAIPDIFRTVVSVTADMAVTAAVAERWSFPVDGLAERLDEPVL